MHWAVAKIEWDNLNESAFETLMALSFENVTLFGVLKQ